MKRYFKIVEIDEDSFTDATGEEMYDHCLSLTVPVDNSVFIAVDDDEECEIGAPVDYFN
jgi:hypothetical protein